MTLYDLWKKAEQELPLHAKISEKYFKDKMAQLPPELSRSYEIEFAKYCPNLYRYIRYSLKFPFTPRMLQKYLKAKTKKNWTVLIEIDQGAPESEILKAKKYCEQKNLGERDLSAIIETLKESHVLRVSFNCSVDMQTKFKLSFESLLLKPDAPVNPFDTDSSFNLYIWVAGGPVVDGKNVWVNCAKNENSQMLKTTILEEMKHVTFLTKEETKDK